MIPTVGAPPELPEGVRVLPPLDESASDEDLAPIAALASGARVVGLGDSVPTSGAFAAAKARITRLLVETAGFRVIALPVSRADGARADEFATTCTGDVASALGPSFDDWATTHVRSLLEWACAYDAMHADDPVRIVGVDVRAPADDVEALHRHVPELAPADSSALLAPLERCAVDANAGVGADAFAACVGGLGDIEAELTEREQLNVYQGHAGALLEARLALTNLRAWQAQSYYGTTDPSRTADAHDGAAAAMLQRIRSDRFPGARVVLFGTAHALLPHAEQLAQTNSPGTMTIGTSLTVGLGSAYQEIAITGYTVYPTAPKGAIAAAYIPPTDAIETVLHRLDRPQLLVDFGSSDLDALFPPAQRYEAFAPTPDTFLPRAELRAIVYIDESAAGAPLAR